jgi:hypothetical protein
VVQAQRGDPHLILYICSMNCLLDSVNVSMSHHMQPQESRVLDYGASSCKGRGYNLVCRLAMYLAS